MHGYHESEAAGEGGIVEIVVLLKTILPVMQDPWSLVRSHPFFSSCASQCRSAAMGLPRFSVSPVPTKAEPVSHLV